MIAGIPDLRLYPDPYIEILEDREKAQRLADVADGLDPAGLLDFYFSITPEVPPGPAAAHRRGILELAPARAKDRMQRLDASVPSLRSRGRILDLGCGAGSWLPELSTRASELVGMDVGLRWLVIARRLLEDRGIPCKLVCGNAEAIPLAPNSVDVVVAANVIEHARDAEACVRQVFSVLDKDGFAYFASPNRFSMLPEPHVRLPGLGLLPRRVADEVVRRTRGVPYGGITLRGAWSWMDLVTSAGFRRVDVQPPLPGPAEREELSSIARLGAQALGLAAGIPGGSTALKVVGPLLEVHAFKGPNRERVPVGREAG